MVHVGMRLLGGGCVCTESKHKDNRFHPFWDLLQLGDDERGRGAGLQSLWLPELRQVFHLTSKAFAVLTIGFFYYRFLKSPHPITQVSPTSTTTEILFHSAEIHWVYVSGTIVGAERQKYMKRLMKLYRVGRVSVEGNTSTEPWWSTIMEINYKQIIQVKSFAEFLAYT